MERFGENPDYGHAKWQAIVDKIQECLEIAQKCPNATMILDQDVRLNVKPLYPIGFDADDDLSEFSSFFTSDEFRVVQASMHLKDDGNILEPAMVASGPDSTGRKLLRYVFNPYEHDISAFESKKPHQVWQQPTSGIRVTTGGGRAFFYLS